MAKITATVLIAVVLFVTMPIWTFVLGALFATMFGADALFFFMSPVGSLIRAYLPVRDNMDVLAWGLMWVFVGIGTLYAVFGFSR